MVRIMKKDGNRFEGIGERIDVRLTLLEEALGMTPGDPEIYGNWIASKAPEPEVGEEEVGVIGNSSYSDVVGVHFLSRGRERVAVGIRRPELKEVAEDGRFANLRGLDSRILFECRAPKGSFDWVEPGNVISERVFFKVDGDWYVDDVREADGAKAKRRERRRRDFYRNFSPRSFHPTKAFLDKWVRGMYGWKNVKPSDVVITRETCAEGIYYRVRKTVGKGDWFSVTSFGKR